MKKKKMKKLLIKVTYLIGPIIISSIITHYYSIKEINYENSLQIIQLNETEYELLEKAEKYFKIDSYIETAHIYNLEKLNTNPIALNNIGYMYENGMLYETNIRKAREYYYKAAKLGNIEAIENYILFSLKYPISIDSTIDVIKFGYENNSYNIKNFLLEYVPNEDFEVLYRDFIELSRANKKIVLTCRMYEIELFNNIHDDIIEKKYEYGKPLYGQNVYIAGSKSVETNLGNEFGAFSNCNCIQIFTGKKIGLQNYPVLINSFAYSTDKSTKFIYI